MSKFYDWFEDSLFYDLMGKRSYSQSGEDMIAMGELPKKGFYVDVGACRPKRFSNTYGLYKKGWRGLVIDPNSELIARHKRIRKRDVAVCVGIGVEKEVRDYLIYTDPELNTFSGDQEAKNEAVGRRVIEKRKMSIVPLSEILDEYLPKKATVDLLSIDAEGMDLQVLESNNWKKYRPKVIICEDLDFDWRNWEKSKVTVLLEKRGYVLLGKTGYSLVFRDSSWQK